jgi:hypothetical protein
LVTSGILKVNVSSSLSISVIIIILSSDTCFVLHNGLGNLIHVIVKFRPELNHRDAQIVGDHFMEPIRCAAAGYGLLNGCGRDAQFPGKRPLIGGSGNKNHFSIDYVFIFVYHCFPRCGLKS